MVSWLIWIYFISSKAELPLMYMSYDLVFVFPSMWECDRYSLNKKVWVDELTVLLKFPFLKNLDI